MSEISRDLADLASQAHSRNHQYPDGLAPVHRHHVRARGRPRRAGSGFTHKTGDVVSIAAPELGALVNEVVTCDQAEPWTFGTGALMAEPRPARLLTDGGRR